MNQPTLNNALDVLTQTENRHVLSLCGSWDFVVDLDPKYHADPRAYPQQEYAQPGANRRHWQKVPVPGVWQKVAQRYEIFEGVAWFAREFDVPPIPQGATAQLRFEGVNYLCRVFMNGEEIGGHEGGYTEFSLDCTRALQPGRNHIAVQVDNRATTLKWPPVLGYFNYGGIHRGVSLEICAGPVLADVRLSAVPGPEGGELIVCGRVAGVEPGMYVCVRSEGLSWEDWISADGTFETRVPFFEVELWSPEHPNLIAVTVELLDPAHQVVDSQSFQCGFRQIAIHDGRILLNGEALELKGVCYVYDSPVHGLVMAPEQIETDLSLIKALGCNAVRCHTPMDRKFYAACDRLGLLVWIEPPVYCYHPGDAEIGTRFADPVWLALAQQTVAEMIAAARCHPSVAIYGIGNECNTANPEAEGFFQQLAATIRAEDPSRLLSYAALYGIVGPLAEMVDVLGINSYWGWYDKLWSGKGLHPESELLPEDGKGGQEPIDLSEMRGMLDGVLARKQDLVLFLTEFGADSVPGFYSRGRDLWSEEYHADLLRAVLRLAGEYSQIVGTFPFCFSDYRDPSKVHNGYWNELNLKGVVSYTRQPKLAFAALREAYLK